MIDSDGDGVGDNSDQCEGFDDSVDVDGDGIIDGCDELIDSDGDGVGDDVDAFPNDSKEWSDSDGNGIGDNQQSAAELQAEEDANQQMMIIVSSGIFFAILVGIGLFFTLKNRKENSHVTEKINQINYHEQHIEHNLLERPTITNQWTDESGYTWRKFSDDTTEWWDGTEWQKI